jgi:hypothetical protein
MLISCNETKDQTIKILGNDSTLIGKYKTEYIIHYSTYWNPTYEIYSDKEIYTCSFQGTNFLLEKDNTEEILSTTAPIQIIKSEIVK